MSTEFGRGYVGIEPDFDGFAQKVEKEVNSAASKASKVAEKAIDLGGKLTRNLTLPIAAGFGLAIKSASDLEQSIGAVDAVFGSAAETVKGIAEGAAEALGLSEAEFNEFASVVGAQLQSLGYSAQESAVLTEGLISTGADLAAQFGGSTSDAVAALSSLMRGERDPIEKYGVSIKQVDVNSRIAALGLDTSTAAAKKNAESQATLSLLTEQTASAQGAFAREAGTAAGASQILRAQVKDLGAEFGEKLLPAAGFVLEAASGLVDTFSSMPEGTQKAIIGVGGLAAALGPLLTVSGNVVKAFGAMRTAVLASGPWGIAIAGAVAVIGYLALENNNAEQRVGELSETINGQTSELTDNTRAWVENDLAGDGAIDAANKIGISKDLLTDAILGEGNARDIVETKIAAEETALAALYDTEENGGMDYVNKARDLDQVTDAYYGGTEEIKKATTESERLASIDQTLVATESLLQDKMVDGKPVRKGLADATGGLDEKNRGLNIAYTNVASSVQGVIDKERTLAADRRAAIDPAFAFIRATDRQTTAQEAYTTAVDKYGVESDEAKAASLDLAAANLDVEDAGIAAAASTEDFDAKLDEWVRTGKLTEQQADDIRESYEDANAEVRNVPSVAKTRLDLNTATAMTKLRDFKNSYSNIQNRSITLTYNERYGTMVSRRTSGGGPGGRFTEKADGGPLDKGELALVGEEGPEFFVPRSAGTIIPAPETKRALDNAKDQGTTLTTGKSSTEVNMNFNGPVDSHKTYRELEWMLRYGVIQATMV